MADAKSLASFVATEKARVEREEAKEEAAELAKPEEEGLVSVRLTRPLYTKEGKLLEAGIHRLPADEVPKSAKKLKK